MLQCAESRALNELNGAKSAVVEARLFEAEAKVTAVPGQVLCKRRFSICEVSALEEANDELLSQLAEAEAALEQAEQDHGMEPTHNTLMDDAVDKV